MKWEKPSGKVMEVTDNKATRDYLTSLGWKEVKDKPKKTKNTKEASD